MNKLAFKAVVGIVPMWLSNQVMKTIDNDGMGAGFIHLLFCFLLIEMITQIIKGFMR